MGCKEELHIAIYTRYYNINTKGQQVFSYSDSAFSLLFELIHNGIDLQTLQLMINFTYAH